MSLNSNTVVPVSDKEEEKNSSQPQSEVLTSTTPATAPSSPAAESAEEPGDSEDEDEKREDERLNDLAASVEDLVVSDYKWCDYDHVMKALAQLVIESDFDTVFKEFYPNSSLLHEAVSSGNTCVVAVILDYLDGICGYKSYPSSTNANGLTPFQLCVTSDTNLPLLELFLKREHYVKFDLDLDLDFPAHIEKLSWLERLLVTWERPDLVMASVLRFFVKRFFVKSKLRVRWTDAHDDPEILKRLAPFREQYFMVISHCEDRHFDSYAVDNFLVAEYQDKAAIKKSFDALVNKYGIGMVSTCFYVSTLNSIIIQAFECAPSDAMVEFLLEQEEIDVNTKNEWNLTPFNYICSGAEEMNRFKIMVNSPRVDINLTDLPEEHFTEEYYHADSLSSDHFKTRGLSGVERALSNWEGFDEEILEVIIKSGKKIIWSERATESGDFAAHKKKYEQMLQQYSASPKRAHPEEPTAETEPEKADAADVAVAATSSKKLKTSE